MSKKYRIIPISPPFDSAFTKAVSSKIARVDDVVARELWGFVYEREQDLPPASRGRQLRQPYSGPQRVKPPAAAFVCVSVNRQQ